VKAAGRTCKALATSVKSSLEVDYYYRATVIIALDAANDRSRGRVTVSGEVLTQGSQEIPPTGDLTASKALANAGGITRFGDQRDVRIIRQTPQGAQTIKFDYKNYLNNKAEDILLQPNDTVNVRARTVVW
jgi:polysaccharide export outer membrane protein